MAKFEDFVKKTAETAETVAEKSVEFAKATGDKAKILGKIVMLSTDINMEKENIKKTNRALGRLYFEKYKDNPDPDFEQCCTEIAVSTEVIRVKRAQIETLKEKLNEDAQKAKEKAAAAAEKAKEKAVEAAEKAAEIAEKAREKAAEAIEKARQAAENLKDDIKEAAEDIVEKVEQVVEDIKEDIAEEACEEEVEEDPDENA